MNIFVAGATGVLGRGAVPLLVEQGHEVRAVARSTEKERWLRDHGARPVAVDLFDDAAVKDAVAGSEVVFHLATSIPRMRDMPKPTAWETNDRLRTTSTKLLVDAALAHGVSTLIAESITFLYDDCGSDWITEDTRWENDDAMSSVVDLEREVERFSQGGSTGIALRFGSFYGPEAQSLEEFLSLARKRVAPFLGSPDAYVSSIHTDDAATATVAAQHVEGGTYNVCDEPLTRRENANVLADAFGLGRPFFIPKVVQQATARKRGEPLLRSQRVSNARFHDAANWSPEFSSALEGWHDVARRRPDLGRAK
jgi:nucleoside-diphosphate-sugar epimerase